MTDSGVKTEEHLIARVARRVSLPRGTGVVAGIGDDCAVYRPHGSREDLLFTTDWLIENVHFRRDTHPPEAVGHKALARGLSDIAAMGGTPRFCLVSLALPEWAGARWVDRFYAGLLKLADRAGAPLAGGDLARAAFLSCDIVVCGAAPRGQAVLRSGARPGDRLYVSGPLGGSALGLASGKGAAWRRHLRPEPRLDLAPWLRRQATAAMDLSDGLSLDLRRLCLASGVSAEVDDVPVFYGASLDQALHGGEDYELLFTAGASARPPKGALPIGGISKSRKPGVILFRGRALAPRGYDHFRSL